MRARLQFQAAHATLCLAARKNEHDTMVHMPDLACHLLQPLHTMGDIQPGVSGVSVFKPVEGVKAAVVKASLALVPAA